MHPIYEYRVLFADTEMLVTARDSEEAQERAIEECEDMQGYSTEVVGIIRSQRV
jgi:hypothetical protein